MRFHRLSAFLITHTANCEALECAGWGHLPQAKVSLGKALNEGSTINTEFVAITKALAQNGGDIEHTRLYKCALAAW